MSRLKEISKTLKANKMNYVKIEMEGQTDREYHGYYSDDKARKYILDKMSPKTRKKLAWSGLWSDGGDTEFTFTIHADDIERLPEIIEAYKSLAAVCGRKEVGVTSAGMHTSVMPNRRYPVASSETPFSQAQLENFRIQMNKLLLGLYILASHSTVTRSFGPRNPTVSLAGKHHAIALHNGTCFEYRVFDTIYHKPERVFENLEIIANTLQFLDPKVKYRGPTHSMNGLWSKAQQKGAGKQKPVSNHWAFVRDLLADRKIHDVAMEQIRFLKPMDLSIAQVKARHKLPRGDRLPKEEIVKKIMDNINRRAPALSRLPF